MQGRAWAFTGSLTVPPKRTSNCDLLQMTKDAFGAVAERPSSGIRYLCVHCDISAFIQTNDAKEAEVPIRGFLQTVPSCMSKWGAWLQSPWERRPMRGGLGNKEFEGAEIEARSAGSQWASESLLVEGTLGRNNARKQASALIFSCLRFTQLHSAMHSRLTHDRSGVNLKANISSFALCCFSDVS